MTADHSGKGGLAPDRPFDVPEQVPILEPALTGLSRAGAAGAEPFLAEGGALWATGIGGRPGFRVGTGRHVLARVTPVGLGAAANTLLFPGVVRRDFVASTGPVVETLVTSTRLPLVVAQWTSNEEVAAGPEPFLPEIRVELASRAGVETTVSRHGRQVQVRAEDRCTVLAMVPGPLAIRVERRSDGSARAVFTPALGASASLLVASGPAERVPSALTAARHLKAHAVRAATGPTDGLVVRSGVPEIDDGVLWLRARIHGQAARALQPHVPLGLAAIATGGRDAASALLALGDDTSAAHAILVARLASTFGELGPATRLADRWAAGDVPVPSALRNLAAGALVRALDRSVPPRVVTRIRELAAATEEPKKGERRLPTVGASQAGGPASADHRWWASMLEGAPSGPVPGHSRQEVTEARRACSAFVSSPDEAWLRWRGALTDAASGSARTLWDPLPHAVGGGDTSEAKDGDGDEGSVAAELLLGLVHGLLGIDPDAPVGRLRMAPRLPSHLRTFSVGGIQVGSCRVALDYRREDGRHVYELSPEAAAVPPLLVLEASVPGRVGRVELDGEPADLEMEVRGGRTRVPVQLPLDQTRRLVVEG